MTFRLGTLPVVAVMSASAVVLTGCGAVRVLDDGSDEPMTMATVDPSTVDIELGEVDAVVVMAPSVPGTRFEPHNSPGVELLGSRHVLRLPTSGGPIDVFEYEVRDAAMGPGVQACRASVFRTGSSAGCGPADELEPDPDRLTIGSWSDEVNMVVEVDGPDDATHLVADHDGQRIAVVPVESLGLFVFGQDVCLSGLTVEAWRNDTLLATEELDDRC